MRNAGKISPDSDHAAEGVTRRKFISVAALFSTAVCSLNAAPDADHMAEEIKKEKIRRAMLAGPSVVTAEATVAEMDGQGNLTVLRHGTNEGVCVQGDQNIIGKVDMALDAMGMVWFKD